MKKHLVAISLLSMTMVWSQDTDKDTIKTETIKEVVVVAKKPTVQEKTDRTVYNVENSSVLAGNTTWDVLKMAPRVNIENDETIKSDGDQVTVYINDRKSIFKGKELKDYLKTIPADNLMKIEVITSPSSRYETSGPVINIVLKKMTNEGIKGSFSVNNRQSQKNNQYSNLSLNYHRKNFTQSLTAAYGNSYYLSKTQSTNTLYADNSVTNIDSNTLGQYKNPSVSSSSEIELNEKNNLGLVLEFFRGNFNNTSESSAETSIEDILQKSFYQTQESSGYSRNLGANLYYKYYDKTKNNILDVNLVFNQYTTNNGTNFLLYPNGITDPQGTRIAGNNVNNNYHLKIDYTQPLGKSHENDDENSSEKPKALSNGNIEFGGKIDFNDNVLPNNYFDLDGENWVENPNRTNKFRYQDNINSAYINYSQTFFDKLETRLGLRYEHIQYTISQEVGGFEKTTSYGTWLPNILLKYNFSENYNLSGTYNHNLWRPYYAEMNPFLQPTNQGYYERGNTELLPNPSDRISLKLGLFKKYFVSATYWFSNQDYWTTYVYENENLIQMPGNFLGLSERYTFSFNTNQSFFKNKLNVNLNLNLNYNDNSDFNKKNAISALNYTTNFGASTNLSYTNFLEKNININAWFGLYRGNWGNSYSNQSNFNHSISATKIFERSNIEVSMNLNNIFRNPRWDSTTFTTVGTFRSINNWDNRSISLTFTKRFGNQKVKDVSKSNVEKDNGGGK